MSKSLFLLDLSPRLLTGATVTKQHIFLNLRVIIFTSDKSEKSGDLLKLLEYQNMQMK